MALPPWITEKLPQDKRVNTKLTRRHVVETMYRADRPFFSLQQIQQQIKPDVSKVTVRNRLTELEEHGVVTTESFADSLTLYYLNHPESEWPLSPEGKQALTADETTPTHPLREFLDHPRVRSIFREELLRSIGWAALGIVGWPILLSESPQLPVNIWTVFGLPVLTWATLTVAMVSVRLLTGSDIQVQSQEGLHVVSLCGILLAGFWVAFAIFILNWPPLPTVGVYLLATVSYLIVYKRVVLPETNLPVTT
jgi:DNA-binding HxlR family transcriptional regulator